MTDEKPATKMYSLRVPEGFFGPIDDWRRKQPDIPSRAVAIRRLIEKALDADDLKDDRKPK